MKYDFVIFKINFTLVTKMLYLKSIDYFLFRITKLFGILIDSPSYLLKINYFREKIMYYNVLYVFILIV